MRKGTEVTQRTPPPDLAPQSPAVAFERFIELVRNSSAVFDADPDVVLNLLRPFLVNPERDERYVREMAEAYGVAQFTRMLRRIPLMKSAMWMGRKVLGTMEQYLPDFIARLRDLENALRTSLRPGSIALHINPIRYIDTPAGFGRSVFHRYRVEVQTLIESTPEDALQSIGVDVTATAGTTEVIVDNMTPQAGFSAVGLKQGAGAQFGHQMTTTEKVSSGGEVSAAGAKVVTGVESTFAEQFSATLSSTAETTVGRIEQYLIARRIGNRAIWRAVAGIGPIDVAGTTYAIDVLIPAETNQMDLHVVARVEWFQAGTVPAELRRTLLLPNPSSVSSLVIRATE